MTNLISKIRYWWRKAQECISAWKGIQKCKKLYPDFQKVTEYDCGKYKFIWGIKSSDDQSQEPANFNTMNDISIAYNREANKYVLSIETSYWIEDTQDVISYLNRLLSQFTAYMNEKGYNKRAPYKFWMSQPSILFEEESIPELYTSFRIFVEGYTKISTKPTNTSTEHKVVLL